MHARIPWNILDFNDRVEMKILNILWDIDGTIFDTYPAVTYAISKSLNEMGLSVALNVIDGLARQSIDHCMKMLAQRFNLDPGLLRQRFVESYLSVDPVNQPPFPGVREVCELIHARGGLNMIITHRGFQSAQRLLNAHDMTSFFDELYSVEQGFPRKPDPAIVLAALERHGIQPDETLLVGDRDLDIQAGRAAGVHTCLFGPTEPGAVADFQVGHYAQLLQILKNEKRSN